jgi:hypothetical protein
LDLDDLTDEANKKFLDQQKRQRNSTANIKANLEAIKSKIDRVYNDRLSGKLAEDDYQRIYNRLKEEQATLQSKIQTLNGSDDDDLIGRQKIEELVNRFLEAVEYSRELIVSLIEKIELTEDKELSIHFRFKELDLPDHTHEPAQLLDLKVSCG